MIVKLRGFGVGATGVLLSALLIPAFRLLHIPRFNPRLIAIFVAAWFIVSLFGSLFFAGLGFPKEVVRQLKRRGDSIPVPWTTLADVFLPLAYFAAGFLLMSAYNYVIAVLCFDGRYDLLLDQVDRALLHGHSVGGIVYRLLQMPSLRWIFPLAQAIYGLLFPQIGAVAILLSLVVGRKESLRYVSALLTAYALALLIFAAVPAGGPAMIYKNHFDNLPSLRATVAYQKFVEAQLTAVLQKMPSRMIGPAYLIACPALHLTQPLIMFWFVRRWRRLRLFLVVYIALLIPSILLLEEHYLVDLIVGCAVAVVAVAVTMPRHTARTSNPVEAATPCGAS